MVTLAIGHVRLLFQCLCPMHEPLYRAKIHGSRPNRAGARGRYGALTLVKQPGLWGSNVLGNGTDYLSDCSGRQMWFITYGSAA